MKQVSGLSVVFIFGLLIEMRLVAGGDKPLASRRNAVEDCSRLFGRFLEFGRSLD